MGQSLLEYRFRPLAVGVTTENLWWGPGMWNALIMSNNAEGIPQAYVKTAAPFRTRFGSFEGRFLVGVLAESRFFDTVSSNDRRSLNAFALSLRTAFDSGLTIGVARASFAQMQGSLPLAHLGDVFLSLPSTGREELQSVFARWSFPEAGTEIHAEWARLRLPSIRDLLVDPQHGQGFSVGAQWRGTPFLGNFRPTAKAEFTTLEQFNTRRGIQGPSFYTSIRVPQGYTQRGQVIGAMIGPGSSSQFLAGGLESSRYDVGLVLSRTRTDDDAYYLQSSGLTHFAHDVALAGAVQAAARYGRWSLETELRDEHRMNYLFQSANLFSWDSTFDVHSLSMRFALGVKPY
jgi:hypothetical protein